jgi:hypothetical protein
MNSSLKLDSLIREEQLVFLKTFQRNKFKTQVILSNNLKKDTVMDRLTHSYIVKNGGEIIAETLNETGIFVNYKYALGNTCLAHDIGMGPFGHLGSETISKRIQKAGLKEGFDDNNNNFVILEKNGANSFLTDYELASIIKYPERLYEYQKPYLHKILNFSINEDVKYFENQGIKFDKKPERTIVCDIMDEADRNSYVSSDLIDCFVLDYSDHKKIEEFIDNYSYYSVEIRDILNSIHSSVKQKDKNLIRFSFGKLFKLFNTNYYLGDNIQLTPKNEEIIQFREDLYKLETDIFINSHQSIKERKKHIKILNKYIDLVLEKDFFPSKTYKKMIENEKDEMKKLTYKRDLIGETSDSFIINTIKKQNGLKK